MFPMSSHHTIAASARLTAHVYVARSRFEGSRWGSHAERTFDSRTVAELCPHVLCELLNGDELEITASVPRMSAHS
jgi:hypothetical protein